MTGLKQVVLLWLAVTAATEGGRAEIVDFKVSFGCCVTVSMLASVAQMTMSSA